MEIEKGGHVNVSPLKLSTETSHDLEDNLLMFFTGYSRNASTVLADQKKRTETNDADMIANLDFIKDLGLSIKAGARRRPGGRIRTRLMHEHWLHKQRSVRAACPTKTSTAGTTSPAVTAPPAVN